ncbi:hypothetical protein KSF_003180 [Reticulibacter mediterranei]|uniref:DUF998 domain-containing protein n=1 Tax=Reticulibacter mediterranei TaxID=2778369 RepID=A0A8J3IGE6_9CHLR|nr:DUF998 domain-containing protein [Reticulibacter mediterranei]GHO90270.1 hypothetical protein KSF_003180 [Reticulibacter mediterranei]
MKISTHSAGSQSARSVVMQLLLACGAIGPLLNTVVILVLGATRPGYNPWRIPDSNLELGVGGWMQISNYIVTGALLLAFAIGLRLRLCTGRGSTWGPILLGIYGLTFIGAGIFVTDPVLGYPPGASSALTVHGILHDLCGQLQFISLSAACFVLARRDAADLARRSWTWYTVATGLLVAASDVFFFLTGALNGPAGLIERIGIIGSCSWIALLAVHLMSRPVPRVSVE